MAKLLRCNDVVPGCPAEVRADDEADLLQQVMAHARAAHGLEEIDDETARRVQAAIRDDTRA